MLARRVISLFPALSQTQTHTRRRYTNRNKETTKWQQHSADDPPPALMIMKLALQSERSRDDDLDPARAGELSACRPARRRPVFVSVLRCCSVMIVVVSSFVPRGAERDEPFSS